MWTKERVTGSVYAEMRRNGGNRPTAIQRFIDGLGNAAKVGLVNDLGAVFVGNMESDYQRKEHPPYPMAMPKNFGRNMKAEAAALAGMMVAIGQTGLRMALGQMTSEECETVANYHHQLAESNRAKSIGWAGVAGQLKAGKTVADSWASLSEDARGFLCSLDRQGCAAA